MEDCARDLGEQPLSRLMAERGLKPRDLVVASTGQITHKMVSRGCRGRRLTRNAQGKLLRAFDTATGEPHTLSNLFTY